jgi:hypothetical protein
MPEENKQQFSEVDINSFYEKAEMDQLKDALKRSYKERFLMTTRLYKIQKMFEKAKITHHRPYNLKK